MDRDTYLFHQTPVELCKDLINFIPIEPNDKIYEPFKGEGSFYNSFPTVNPKDWSEIEQGRDFKDYTGDYDWVITNPPFRLDHDQGRMNSFYYLLDYYSKKAKKGIAFLGNDKCFSSMTTRRLNILKDRGWYITKIIVCAIKKWRGRYFFIIFQKKPSDFYNYLLTNY
jgi:hypothetical protein